MDTHRRITHLTMSLLTTAALAISLCGPAEARQDLGAAAHAATDDHCTLERIGSQLVRCGDLTGNGVPAPLYIPEQG